MFCEIIININFWAAFSGLIGTVFIFFFGLPPRIDINGHVHLILEQENINEKKKAKVYKQLSYTGLLLLAISFLLQIINIINKTINK